jgi:hypothetical protein
VASNFNPWVPQGTITLTGTTPEQPSVIREGNAQILSGTVFKIWYQTGGANPSGPSSGMYYAESTDGINFTAFGSNPVLAGAWGTKVFKNGSTYYCYYTTGIESGSTKILVATSTNGTTWVAQSPTNSITAANSPWATLGIVGQLNVAGQVGSTWWGYYFGAAGPSLGSQTSYPAGAATSPDLINWTPVAGNPVSGLTSPGGAYADFGFATVNGVTYAWGQGALPNQSNAQQSTEIALPSDIFRWSAPSPAGPWTRLGTGSTLYRSLASEGVNTGAGQVADPTQPIADGSGNLWIYYTASTNGGSGTNYTINAAKAAATTLAQLVSSYEGINNFPISGNPSLNFSTLGTDSFQRANANPIGGNWTTSGTFGALQIVSDAVEAATGGTVNVAYWNASAFNNDQWSQITVGATIGTSAVGPAVRLGTASENGYAFLWQGTTGSSGTWRLQKYVSGTVTQLATGTLTVSTGDTLAIAAVGTNIYLYWNGVFVFTISDSALTSGSAGMLVFSASGTTQATITGWSGGNFQNAPAPPPVGGSGAVPWYLGDQNSLLDVVKRHKGF